MRKYKGFKIIGIPIFIIAVLSGFSLAVMYLWNFAVVGAIGLNEINFWQAAGLLVLSKILFGFGFGGRGGKWSSKRWSRGNSHLTEEQKEHFKQYVRDSQDEIEDIEED